MPLSLNPGTSGTGTSGKFKWGEGDNKKRTSSYEVLFSFNKNYA